MNTPDSHRRAVAGVRADMKEIETWPPERRRAWDSALDYYEHDLARLDLVFDARIIAVTDRVAAQESSPSLQASGLEPALVRALESAAPAYRAGWWARHDRDNRAWVAAIDPLLQKYGASMSRRITGYYRTSWPAKPFRVDVCAYANWAGAYTVDEPARITLSSLDEGTRGTAGLEALFHESLHVLETAVVAALGDEARAQGKEVPRLLSHALIFYTAGEVTRQTVPGYTPYAISHQLWDGEPWSKYQRLLITYWQPYLDGKSGFEEALKHLIAAS